MTADRNDRRSATLVWIDAREAVIVRVDGGPAQIERVESEVPAHHRATGHVRHDPAVRHGGGGSPESAGERHRIEHLNQFIREIAGRLSPGDDLLLVGPGQVHERLSRHVSESDGGHGRRRQITCEASGPMTDRQLIARVLRSGGVEPRRHTLGAYRWSDAPEHLPSGREVPPPRRVGARAHASNRNPIQRNEAKR